MKQRVSSFLAIFLIAGVLAACGGTPAATQPTAATGGEPTAATGSEATAAPTTAASTGGSGETIRIVSSLPRQGASKGQTDAVVNAIKMRLEEDNYQACSGQFTIDYQDLDDATAA
ncbi:MAG TPA: hypothetical protein VFT99_17385, partial [Roseiflexaceae bacterium]|nr:hypothetical protein [Roseiflexaceae bacterium]